MARWHMILGLLRAAGKAGACEHLPTSGWPPLSWNTGIDAESAASRCPEAYSFLIGLYESGRVRFAELEVWLREHAVRSHPMS